MSNLRFPSLVLALATTIAITAQADAVDNISGFSFATYVDGPVLVSGDLTGRVVGVFAPCNY
jgi:hypothetical protein